METEFAVGKCVRVPQEVERRRKRIPVVRQAAITKAQKASKEDIAELHCSIAESLWAQKKRDEALDEWRTALKIFPKCKETKQSLKECTNVYGEPKAPNDTFDDLYHFQGVHIQRYLSLIGREEFVTQDEMHDVQHIVQDGWNNNIPPHMPEFDRWTAKEKSAFFKSITLNFTETILRWKKL